MPEMGDAEAAGSWVGQRAPSIAEQRRITDERVIPVGKSFIR